MKMADVHPNLILLGRFAELLQRGLTGAEELFADDFVWHYFNPHLPELAGDYAGLDGLRSFFQKLGRSFRTKEGQTIPIGDELVVTTRTNMITLDGEAFELDAVVVWRIVDNRIAEAWDIPAAHMRRMLQK